MNRIPRLDSVARRLPALAMAGSLAFASRHSPGMAFLMIGLSGLVCLAVIAIVIYPAVWSKSRSRRDAAFAVLDRLLRR